MGEREAAAGALRGLGTTAKQESTVILDLPVPGLVMEGTLGYLEAQAQRAYRKGPVRAAVPVPTCVMILRTIAWGLQTIAPGPRRGVIRTWAIRRP